jgi:hypothetical protein
MSFQYGYFFRVLEIDRLPADMTEFDNLLSPTGVWDLPAEKIKRILTPLCKSVVVEKEYIDDDYRAGFARYHYMGHHDTDRRCTRLHFFASPINKRQLFKMTEQKKEDYLGFVVIRPLAGFRLGRSIFSTKLVPAGQPNEKTYLTCQTRYRANLAGNEIEFYGVPWMQQDTLVSACASAALWVASTHMATEHAPQYQSYCTPTITDMATRYALSTGRPMPSGGLTPDQMMTALQGMGYEPVPYVPESAFEARNILYRYIESEIPVIMGIKFTQGGHAVTAIGHTFDAKFTPSVETFKLSTGKTLSITRTSEFVPRIIIQDDAGGPFRFLEFMDWEKAVDEKRLTKRNVKELKARYSCPVILDKGSGDEGVGFLMVLVVPLPSGIMLDGYGAEERAIALYSTACGQWGIKPPKLTVFRTFLFPSNNFKNSYEDVTIEGDTRTLIRELRRQLMPKWIWVTEVSDHKDFLNNGRVLGQIIQDSASHATSPDFFDLIAVHLPGLLAVVRPDRQIDVVNLPENARIPRLIRP